MRKIEFVKGHFKIIVTGILKMNYSKGDNPVKYFIENIGESLFKKCKSIVCFQSPKKNRDGSERINQRYMPKTSFNLA